MKIIEPLGVDAIAALGRRPDDTRVVEVAFRDQPGRAAEACGLRVKVLGHFLENMARAEIENAVDGVEAQRVDVILRQPVEGVVHKEAAHAVALRRRRS